MLHEGTYLLVGLEGLFGKSQFTLVEVLGLHLHAETARHGYIETELEGNDASGLVVGRGTHVLGHGESREEHAGAPLDEEALLGIGVVAYPELVKVGHEAVVDAAATAGTVLHDEVGIFLADALEGLEQTELVIDIEMALAVGGEIVAAEVDDVHVGIPLEIVQVGVLLHEVINHLEDEVLHLGVAEVEDQLRAAASGLGLAVGMAHDPVGMLLVEFGEGVGHLGFYPNAELQSALLGCLHEGRHALGQLHGVGLPVAQSVLVHGAAVLGAEPPVIHDEEFAAQHLQAVHHLFEVLLAHVHIDALPGVEQNLAVLHAVGHHALLGPAVEGAAHATQSLLAVGIGQYGGGEALARLEGVGRVFLVDACHEVVHLLVARLHEELVVAVPAEHGTDGASAVLAGSPVE